MSRLALLLLAACAAAPTPGATDDGKDDGTGHAHFHTAPHRAWPQIPARDGVVMSGMKLVWITSPDDDAGRTYYRPLFDAFAAPANAWWSAVADEYGVAPPSTVIEVRGASALADTTPYSTTALRSYVADAIAGDPALAPDGSTLYVLLLPEHVGTGTPCSAGGSHSAYGNDGDAWAHVTRCGATVGMYTATHEIIEAATNPTDRGYQLAFDRSSPWTSSVFAATDGEVADLCEGMGSFYAEGVKYQRSWSNAAAATGGAPCVPAATSAFFAVSVDQDWTAIAPGATIQIPLTGFSTRAMSAWQIAATVVPRPAPGSGDRFAVSVTRSTIGNGGTSSLVVTADATVAAGAWALIRVVSDAGTGEQYAVPVGVYVGDSH